jgi:DNA-binding CsgD family transcriptional regulator
LNQLENPDNLPRIKNELHLNGAKVKDDIAVPGSFASDNLTNLQSLQKLQSASSIKQLIKEFQKIISRIGLDTFVCIEVNDLENFPGDNLVLGTLDRKYIEHYWQSGIMFSDPMARSLVRSVQPVRISSANQVGQNEPKTNQAVKMRLEQGIQDGYVFPLKGRLGRLALATVQGNVEGFGPAQLAVLEILVLNLYRRATELNPLPSHIGISQLATLTDRERQCLSWVAKGKTNWDISQILRITERTVQYHIENVRQKMGVDTRMQAVVIAMRNMEISPW